MPKIIVLYILKQVTKTIFFTFLILFGILFFNESIQFLEKASRGDLYPSLLIPVLFYSLPATLEVSIPISVFLGILISIYNLNKTNELSFIYQLGMGQKNLTLVTLIPVIFCSFFVFFNSFYFVPQSNENLSFLSDSQSFSDKFKLMGEGKINAFPDLGGIIFAKEASDRGFKDVFANFNSENSDLILNSKEVLGSSQDEKLNKLTFESGNLVIPSQSGTIDLEFEELFFLFNKKQKLAEKNIEKMSLSLLIQEDKNEDFYAEFLKRLSLSLLSNLKTPVIVIITGEGGSGGALAIGIGDHVCMLEHSIYAVASPEACASIVWRDGSKAKDAAEAMKVDASNLRNLGLVDEVIEEPLGGAHRDIRGVSNSISQVIEKKLQTFDEVDIADLLKKRYEKIMSYGSI